MKSSRNNPDIYSAAAAGEAELVSAMLERDRTLATTPGGPEEWEPLLYLCFSPLLQNPQHSERFARTAGLLLAHGANANAQRGREDEYGRRPSALYGAAGIAGSAAVARLLLEAGADPNDGESLYHAAEQRDTACLELLYEYGADLNGTPALYRKLDFEDQSGVKWFLERGADPNVTFGTLGPALHWAIRRGRSAPIIELLIDAGGDVNARSADGKTAYMLAVRYGRTDIAHLLRARGASTAVDAADLLIAAYAVADASAVRRMLADDPKLLPSLSHTDLCMLLEFAELNKPDSVSLMLDTGVDITTSRHEGNALHIAGWFGHIETVMALISRGAPLTQRNSYGGAPLDSTLHGSLHCPAKRAGAHAAVAAALLQAGAPVPAGADGAADVIAVLRAYGKGTADD